MEDFKESLKTFVDILASMNKEELIEVYSNGQRLIKCKGLEETAKFIKALEDKKLDHDVDLVFFKNGDLLGTRTVHAHNSEDNEEDFEESEEVEVNHLIPLNGKQYKLTLTIERI